MDVNNLLHNEFGVVALPYLINNSTVQQDGAAALVSMPTVISQDDVQWLPDSNGSVLLTFSAINNVPIDKPQEANSSTTLLPFLSSMFVTEDGTLLSAPLDGSPQTLTLLEPATMVDSPQTIVDIEQTALTLHQAVSESVYDPTSEGNSPLTLETEDGVNAECVNERILKLPKGFSMDDVAIVTTALKCKMCEFQCGDKDEITRHYARFHFGGSLKLNKKLKAEALETEKFNQKKERMTKRVEKVLPSKVKEGNESMTHMFFSCGACLKVCTSMAELRDHMKTIHGIKKDGEEEEIHGWREVGSKCSPVETELLDEIESVSEMEACAAKQDISIIAEPSSTTVELKFHCNMCKAKFSTQYNLDRHRKCHTSTGAQPRFKCLLCDQSYNRWKFCAGHLWIEHKIELDIFSCGVCDYKTAHQDKFLAHKKRHSALKEFCCRYCQKPFSQRTQLRNHEVLHLKKNANAKLPEWVKPKECDHCHKTFSDSKALKNHVKTVHSKLKPYVCQVCGHCSARKGMFQLHIRQHTGDKPFSCSACDFTTRDHNSLRRHTMRHTGVRQYHCKFCSYSAIQSHVFKHHLIKNHGGDGVFLCNVCSFSTLNEQAFIYHHHHDEVQKPDKESEDVPTLIYVPFNDKDKTGAGELIAIDIPPDDEESNNFSDGEAAIDTGGITIAEDVEVADQPVNNDGDRLLSLPSSSSNAELALNNLLNDGRFKLEDRHLNMEDR